MSSPKDESRVQRSLSSFTSNFPKFSGGKDSSRTSPDKSHSKMGSVLNKKIDELFIYPKLPEIMEAVKKSMITIIRSHTGSGKTIGVPNFLATNNITNDKSLCGNIFCSVPSEAATRFAYQFQNQLCSQTENYVGYACDDDIHYESNTKIIYCNTRHLLNKTIRTISNLTQNKYRKFAHWFCSILILDEFHARTKESDICLCLWIYYYHKWKENPTLPQPPKLIIMSATLDDSIIHLLPTTPTELTYSIQMYDVSTCFDNVSSQYNMDADERYNRTAFLAFRYHQQNYQGVYLIFVPGKQEIDIVTNALKKKFIDNVDIYSAHSELTIEELLKIHEPEKDGRRKIVVATNIAECSLTIENVSLVIDTLTHREARSSLDESVQLDLYWISKASSNQRRGRTGRTCLGNYVVMQSKDNYNQFSDTSMPEIERITISYDILKLLKFGLEPKIILNSLISDWQIEMNVNLLKKLGFIENFSPLSIKVSDMGDFCSEFPLSIRKSAMLYHLKQLDDPNIFLYLAVICTLNCYGSGIFIWPKKTINDDNYTYSLKHNDILQKLDDEFGGYSDVDTIFNIWIKICSSINPFYIPDLRTFCISNNLNFRRFKETINLLKQCVIIGNRSNISLHAYHNVKTFVKPNINDLNKTFYYLLKLTHADYETIIKLNNVGDAVAICGGMEHRIDNKSVHTMNLGNNSHKIYYSLVRTQRKYKKGIMRIVSVLHGVASHSIDGDFSIFSSDDESEIDIEDKNYSISVQENWNKFLSILEMKLLPFDMDQSSDNKIIYDIDNDDNLYDDII